MTVASFRFDNALRRRPEEHARKCSVDGCDKPHRARGFCGSHYQRFRRYGDPLLGGPELGLGLRFFQDVVLASNTDDCLFWPYGRAGRGYAVVGKKYVHRLACEHIHGQPPTAKHEAAHSCGNGHLGCVNPRHLYWKTTKENHADKIIHGTMLRGEKILWAKLKTDDVLQIRALSGTMSQRELSDMFDVSRGAIRGVISGRNWGHLMEHSIAHHRFNNTLRRRSESDDGQRYLTPEYILSPVRALLGGIELDPCSEPDNPTGASQFFFPPLDGCELPWRARTVFCNPPYGEARDRWVDRCLVEGARGVRIVLLIPAATDIRTFQKAFAACTTCLFLKGRVKFGVLRPNRRQEAASHGSALLGFGVNLVPLGDLGVVTRPATQLPGPPGQ
jgi:hypothetical protein